MPPQDAYLESQVLTADPIELVRLLYRGALDATRAAAGHLAAGRIAERARQITKAHAILSQLSVSLDRVRGGALSHSLAELYDYMQRQLLDANLRQQAEPLREVENLLATLLDGWDRIGTGAETSTADQTPSVEEDAPRFTAYSPAVFAPEPAAEYASQSWSF